MTSPEKARGPAEADPHRGATPTTSEDVGNSNLSAVDRESADPQAAIAFLQWLRPGGEWNLVAISTEEGEPLHAITLRDPERVRVWLENEGATRNIYYTLNRLSRDMATKPGRRDIREMEFLHVDIDPEPGETPEECRERVLPMVRSFRPEPSAIVNSGGGVQVLWRLVDPVEINGKEELYEDAKRYNLQLEQLFKADGCHNVDRIMRLPGTVNRPNSRKKAKGRREALAEVVELSDRAHELKLFTPAPKVQVPGSGFSGSTVKIPGNVQRVDDLSALPIPNLCKVVIAQGNDPDDPDKWPSRSEPLFWVCCELVRAGVTDEVIYAIITDPVWDISASVLEKGSGAHDYAVRQIERAREEAVDPWLRRLNDEYSFVASIGGRARIMRRYFDPALRQEDIEFLLIGDFVKTYGNQVLMEGKKERPVGDWWVKHPLRKTFKTVTFAPGETLPRDVLNLWTGFAVEPIPGDCSLFLDHLRDNVCQGCSATTTSVR